LRSFRVRPWRQESAVIAVSQGKEQYGDEDDGTEFMAGFPGAASLQGVVGLLVVVRLEDQERVALAAELP